jgi:hypothetical protein
MMGETKDRWTSFQCSLAASFADQRVMGTAHAARSSCIAFNLSWGNATDCASRSQIYLAYGCLIAKWCSFSQDKGTPRVSPTAWKSPLVHTCPGSLITKTSSTHLSMGPNPSVM